MKKITISHVMYFPDDLPDDKCVNCIIEVAGQSDINDENIKIEYNQTDPDEN